VLVERGEVEILREAVLRQVAVVDGRAALKTIRSPSDDIERIRTASARW
jgi:hypothetical protein